MNSPKRDLNDQQGRVLVCLRDFFLSRQLSDMAAASIALSRAGTASVSLAATDWQDVEFGFNKLFVGPQALLAPPFASIYLESEPRVMGETTLMVRRLYETVGLVSPWRGQVPDDHIALELDACLHIRRGLLQSGEAKLGDIYSYLLNEHMARWVPAFSARIIEAREVPVLFGWVGRELDNWLACERRAVDPPPGTSRDN